MKNFELYRKSPTEKPQSLTLFCWIWYCAIDLPFFLWRRPASSSSGTIPSRIWKGSIRDVGAEALAVPSTSALESGAVFSV